MKIATWNINGLNARLDFVLHWLDARQPDVVGLQELKRTDEQFPYDVFEGAGYKSLVHGQKAWNGVAILSREAGEIRQAGLPGQEDFGARLITAEVSGLRFTTVYCPNGKHLGHDDFPKKLVWFDDLIRHMAETTPPDGDAVLCGDFNLCPASIDAWSDHGDGSQIFRTPEERQRWAQLEGWGWIDLYRDLLPDERKFSWWDYRGGSFHKNEGLRIDMILGTKSVRERLESIEIDRDYRKKKEGLIASDHAPVIAVLS